MNKNGIGLGLVIAKQIVEQFNGEINVSSTIGKGTTFTFTFQISENEVEIDEKSNQIKQENFMCNSASLIFKWKPDMIKENFKI